MGAVNIPSPQGLVMVSHGAGAAALLGRSLKMMGKGETSVGEGPSPNFCCGTAETQGGQLGVSPTSRLSHQPRVLDVVEAGKHILST